VTRSTQLKIVCASTLVGGGQSAARRDPRSPESKELASCLASSRLLFNSFNPLTHSPTESAEDAGSAAALALGGAV
jgi:hypothetical protein